MSIRFSNNASTTLAGSLTNVATSLSVAAGDGTLFPTLVAGDFFMATLIKLVGGVPVYEIVKVTARATDVFTIVRAQEGTTAVTFAAGDRLENRMTAAVAERLTKRVASVASSSTPTPNADTTDLYHITALAATATFGAPTGTPSDGQQILMRVKDNGTARVLAWNAIYRASTDLPLPSTTIAGKIMYVGFIYNAPDSKWDQVAYLNNI